MANDFDTIKKNANTFITDIHKFIKDNFHVSIGEQKKYIDNVTKDSVQNGKATIVRQLYRLRIYSWIVPLFQFILFCFYYIKIILYFFWLN